MKTGKILFNTKKKQYIFHDTDLGDFWVCICETSTIIEYQFFLSYVAAMGYKPTEIRSHEWIYKCKLILEAMTKYQLEITKNN